MKTKSLGRRLDRSETKQIFGGLENEDGGGGSGGGCPGNGSGQYYHVCTDGQGNGTGQIVCCTGIAGNEMPNGVHCVIMPYQIDLYVYCN